MTKTFDDKIGELATDFKDTKYSKMAITTVDNIMVNIEKCSPLKALIKTVCNELAETIEDEFVSGEISFSDIEHMGFTEISLNINRKGSEDNDNIIIECDIWESIS